MNQTVQQPTAVNVFEVIDAQPLSSFQIRVFVLCALTAMIDGFDTQCIGFVAPVIMKQWGIESGQFGLIFAAGLLGVLVGSIALSPLADRVGRRKVIIASAVAFGTLSVVTAYAQTLNELLILRFLTGLGLGGAVPNIIALTAEYAPRRLKALMVVIMFSGFPLGGFLGGMVSSQLIESFGWESVFIFGGLLPLALAVVLLWKLPESIPFLLHHDQRTQARTSPDQGATWVADRRPARYLALIAPRQNFANDTLYVPEQSSQNSSVRELFAGGRATATLMLWVIFLCTLMMFYFMISWLPTILTNAGAPVGSAIMAALFLNAGSVLGGILLARYVDRKGSVGILVFNYVGAALSYVLVGVVGSNLIVVGALVFCAGFFVGGGQLVANALASTYYPTSMRSTGVGWAFGAGRVGSLAGPVIGGVLLAAELDHAALFLIAAIPALFAAIAAFVLARETGRSAATAPFAPVSAAQKDAMPS